MPKEYEFMKSAREKEMSDDEYKSLRDQYDKKADILYDRIKKLIFTFLIIYAISFALLYLYIMFGENSEYIGGFMFVAVEFLLVIFLYDPKTEENNKLKYEKDKKILLNSVKDRISAYKIKLGLVIGLGILFLILNIILWIIFGQSGETVEDLRLINSLFSFVL